MDEDKKTYEEMQTQGRQGKKMKRISIAFGDAEHEYVKFAARFAGMSMTAYINMLIRDDKRRQLDNPENKQFIEGMMVGFRYKFSK